MSDLVGYWEGARIEVEWRDGRQMVIMRLPATGREQRHSLALVEVLRGRLDHSWIDEAGEHMEFAHDETVDRRIVELIDLLANLRAHHPQMIQLPLALSPEEAIQIEEILVR